MHKYLHFHALTAKQRPMLPIVSGNLVTIYLLFVEEYCLWNYTSTENQAKCNKTYIQCLFYIYNTIKLHANKVYVNSTTNVCPYDKNFTL